MSSIGIIFSVLQHLSIEANYKAGTSTWLSAPPQDKDKHGKVATVKGHLSIGEVWRHRPSFHARQTCVRDTTRARCMHSLSGTGNDWQRLGHMTEMQQLLRGHFFFGTRCLVHHHHRGHSVSISSFSSSGCSTALGRHGRQDRDVILDATQEMDGFPKDVSEA